MSIVHNVAPLRSKDVAVLDDRGRGVTAGPSAAGPNGIESAPLNGNRDAAGALGIVAALLLAFGLSLYGQGWGLPDTRSWSNDDIAPKAPMRAVEVWREGWYKYPSLQPLIDRVIYEPWLASWRRSGAIVDTDECRIPEKSRCFDDPHARLGWLLRLSRLRSALMAVGTVLAAWAITLRVGGGRMAAAWAALFAACLQSLIFFAHTGNVDVPQVFWFAWALVAWLAAMQGGRLRSFVAFGALAAAALATKEAIVGAFVLPGMALLWRLVRDQLDLGGRGVTASVRAVVDTRFIALVAVLFGGYGLINNVVFNPAGFQQHVEYWLVGSGIEPWNDAFAGYTALAARTWRRLDDAMGGPLLWWGTVAALWVAWRRPAARVLWLPLVSYSLFTIGLVRYVYTRFTLPMAIILCVLGGLMAEAASRERGVRRVATLVVAGLVLAHSLLYTLHMDRLLVHDARYAAEAWLADHAPAVEEPRIVALGSSTYLPRLDWLGYDAERLDEDEFTIETLAKLRPALIVISGKSLNGLEGAPVQQIDSVIAAAGEFEIVFDYKARSGLERFIVDPYVETRINPRIVVLRRVDGR